MWLGINDENGCVQHFHELRLELKNKHGVELVGPGYSWPMMEGRFNLSVIIDAYGKPDWIVLDDSNALGYVPLRIAGHPSGVKVAWRENDFHNKYRQATGNVIDPDLIMAILDRPKKGFWGSDPFRTHPGWELVPHAVNTKRFCPNGNDRPWNIILYGKTGPCYRVRSEAKQVLRGRKDAVLPTHGGYWRDGRGSIPGKTYYNDELAALLAQCKMAWVDGSDYKAAVMKYFECAAAGCLMVGQKPYGWHRYFPDGAMVECEPGELPDIIRFYSRMRRARKSVANLALEHVRKYHSTEERAKQIMALLEGRP